MHESAMQQDRTGAVRKILRFLSGMPFSFALLVFILAACAAGSIFLVQTMFNVLGTVDILPLTGVTFPFLSNGGSGMIAAWGLLAFVKSVDTRQNASFTIRLPKKEAAV